MDEHIIGMGRASAVFGMPITQSKKTNIKVRLVRFFTSILITLMPILICTLALVIYSRNAQISERFQGHLLGTIFNGSLLWFSSSLLFDILMEVLFTPRKRRLSNNQRILVGPIGVTLSLIGIVIFVFNLFADIDFRPLLISTVLCILILAGMSLYISLNVLEYVNEQGAE